MPKNERLHLDYDSALDLFCHLFENGDPRHPACHLIAVADYSRGDRASVFHFASGQTTVGGFNAKDAGEIELSLRPRHCILSGSTPVADAVACLRAYAAQLSEAAAALESEEPDWIARRAIRIA